MSADPDAQRRPRMLALASAMGIQAGYYDVTRHEMHHTSAATYEAILAAMGHDASSEEAAGRELELLNREMHLRVCDTVQVVPRGRPIVVDVVLPDTAPRSHWELHVRREDGETFEVRGVHDVHSDASAAHGRVHIPIAVPVSLPDGYHQVQVRVEWNGNILEGRQRLIVTPWKCADPVELLEGRRAFGIAANLYTLRGAGDRGLGDFATLDALCGWGARQGADFIGVNPLHALRNRGEHISPYSPSSRLFRNVLYIDPASVPELAVCDRAKEMLSGAYAEVGHKELGNSRLVQYERILDVTLPILRELHGSFRASVHRAESERGREYDAYRARRGELLQSFATFETIAEQLRASRGDGSFLDWASWPVELRDHDSASVAELGARHAEEVDFHSFLQFELDRQLGAVQHRARLNGMRIGLYQDLALGSAGGGFDSWRYRDLFASGVNVGAPPDAFAAGGQTWGFPPLAPRMLRDSGYEYWSELLRSAFEHSGMLRIDHVMGMWRQFWVPSGAPGTEGAYVEYSSHELLGILALESTRAGALVVGEDLGTVPAEVRPALQERGIMGSKVLYFERDESGGFTSPERYPQLSIASINTHDLPPLAAWWLGLDIRRRHGLVEGAQPEKLEHELAHRRWERKMLGSSLVQHDLLAPADADRLEAVAMHPDSVVANRELFLRLVRAAHDFLCGGTPLLVSVALDDVALEIEAVNVPGVGWDRHLSWSRRMSVSLPEVLEAAVGCMSRRSKRMDSE